MEKENVRKKVVNVEWNEKKATAQGVKRKKSRH